MTLHPHAHMVIELLDLPSSVISRMNPMHKSQLERLEENNEHQEFYDIDKKDVLLDMLLHIFTASRVFRGVLSLSCLSDCFSHKFLLLSPVDACY
jgi:hypothetical protein